jgi:enediyne biosynthesis protein E5
MTASTATLFLILGHWFLGFEQTLVHVGLALITGHGTAFLLEWVDAKANGVKPPFVGKGWRGVLDFMAAPHMTSVTTSFLIYPGSYNVPLMFTVALAIASKYLFRVQIDGRWRHFFNPSNFGISITFLLFPWMTTIPYQFTEETYGFWESVDLLLPLTIIYLGSNVNRRTTKRLPLIFSWLAGYISFGMVRAVVTHASVLSAFTPMTGIAFILFTLYMITDPMTSPSSLKGQIAFGLGIAVVYGLLIFVFHVIFTLFFSVAIVCAIRGAWLTVEAWNSRRDAVRAGVVGLKAAT